MRNKPEALIFDMDGTLFQSETLIIPAFRQTFAKLREEGLYTEEPPADEVMLSTLGMVLSDIWEQVLPGSSDKLKARADELFLHYEIEGLAQGLGELYPKVHETLTKLRESGYRLFVASNGLELYIDKIVEYKNLTGLFEGLYSAGKYNTSSKVDLVRILKEQHHIDSAWMVGDRSSDVEAGKANGLFVVGCQYAGFGKKEELNDADENITDFSAILTLLGEAENA